MSEAIDILVAQKVMGWKRRTKAEAWGYDTPDTREPDDGLDEFDNQWWLVEDGRWKAVAYVEDEGSCREDAEDGFSPSERIDHAWLVVGRMRELIGPTAFRLWSCTVGYEARFCLTQIPNCYGDTAPLAICKAALLALNEEIPE